jgi:hypothetical protein
MVKTTNWCEGVLHDWSREWMDRSRVYARIDALFTFLKRKIFYYYYKC